MDTLIEDLKVDQICLFQTCLCVLSEFFWENQSSCLFRVFPVKESSVISFFSFFWRKTAKKRISCRLFFSWELVLVIFAVFFYLPVSAVPVNARNWFNLDTAAPPPSCSVAATHTYFVSWEQRRLKFTESADQNSFRTNRRFLANK